MTRADRSPVEIISVVDGLIAETQVFFGRRVRHPGEFGR